MNHQFLSFDVAKASLACDAKKISKIIDAGDIPSEEDMLDLSASILNYEKTRDKSPQDVVECMKFWADLLTEEVTKVDFSDKQCLWGVSYGVGDILSHLHTEVKELKRVIESTFYDE